MFSFMNGVPSGFLTLGTLSFFRSVVKLKIYEGTWNLKICDGVSPSILIFVHNLIALSFRVPQDQWLP